MIKLNYKHIIKILDLVEKEKENLEKELDAIKPKSIVGNFDYEDEDEKELQKQVDFINQIKEMIDSEVNKVSFNFRLDQTLPEKTVQSLIDKKEE